MDGEERRVERTTQRLVGSQEETTHRAFKVTGDKEPVKMLLNTRWLKLLLLVQQEGILPRFIQQPLLIGSKTTLVDMRPSGASLAVSIIMPPALSFLDAD